MDLSIFKKITDFIMPLEPIEEETEEKAEEKTEKKVEPAKSEPQQKRAEEPSEELRESFSAMEPVQEFGRMRTAEGGSVAFAGMKYTAYAQKEEPVIAVKPQLTVVKGAGISVKINKPTKFEEVRNIADDLLEKNVVIVNYELVETEEQVRISDFVNGVCYVTDGHVNQISEKIILYTPNGVDAEAALTGYAMR